ncbi:TRAP transporter large permease [Planococcus sp. CAU13]|uniref:TRAP transporter large permease n=1 Tax=Planococcus sp. CAU13 TaxID=1541197 RepID=UPI00052FF3B3|nr:TRAP transporter large permease [Planococcus sp. CAU13]
MTAVLIGSLFSFFIIGVPIAIALGLSAVLTLLYAGETSLILVAQRMFTSIDSFSLMAIPFFILAGKLMETSGISQRLINFANSLTGHRTGGLAMVTVLTSMFFAAISGSSAATVAAVGSILIPSMIARGYHRNFAGAVTAVSGELGIIIPPSVPLILYGVTTNTSIGDLFMAGISPGIVIVISLLILVYMIAKKRNYPKEVKAKPAEVWAAFKDAILALLMPVIILGGIYGGIFTPTEAAVVSVFYAFVIGTFVYREIKIKNLHQMCISAGVTSAIVMFIIANAGIFGLILSREGIPTLVATFFTNITDNPLLFLLMINLLLIIVGMFMETSASVIILAPLLAPVAVAMGIDPVHFGIIMIINLALGMCTPPLGVNLFISCQIAKIKLTDITRGLIPFYGVLFLVLMLISYVPIITMWLPTLYK